MNFNLNDLLERDDLDPKRTLVMRHTPRGRFRRMVPFIMDAIPEMFTFYQTTQVASSVIATFRDCDHALSFIGYEGGETIFASAFNIGAERTVKRREYEMDSRWQRLHHDFGLDVDTSRNPDQQIAMFDHTSREPWKHLSGRLRVNWPGGTRSWCRRAHTNTFEITAITVESDFSDPIPSPEELTLRAPELSVLPPSWQAELARWKGVYLITVEGEGARYVGSAYGSENLLGRWRAHVARDVGLTKELATRSTSAFRFSILELLSPDATMKEVVARERLWMERLHTIKYGLNT